MFALSSLANTAYIMSPVISSACFVAGYALNPISQTICRIGVKYLKLPIDQYDGKSYEEYSNSLVQYNQRLANEARIPLARVLGKAFVWTAQLAVTEEILYRYLVETVVLPLIFPQLAAYSFSYSCVSTLLFASVHLNNEASNQALAGQFINTAILGAVCSAVRHKFGLIGAIFIHVGYNFYGTQNTYNLSSKITPKIISYTNFADCFNLSMAIVQLQILKIHLTSPFTLPYRGIMKLLSAS